MKILLADKRFQPRTLCQEDMYSVVSKEHTLADWREGEGDVLWLGPYFQSMVDEDPSVLRDIRKDLPTVVDQADNEEFVLKDSFSALFPRCVVAAKHLPNYALSVWSERRAVPVVLLPRYVAPERVKRQADKTLDVCCVFSTHTAHRRSVVRFVQGVCEAYDLTLAHGEVFGDDYLDAMNRARVAVCVCDRECLTAKYLEAAVCGCAIVGDVPKFPENDASVVELNMLPEQIPEILAGWNHPVHSWAKQFTDTKVCLENFNNVLEEVLK